MTSQILLNSFLRTQSFRVVRKYVFREDIQATLENIDELPETHGLFFEFFLNLVVDSFEVLCSQKVFVVIYCVFRGSVPYLEKDLFL